MPKTVERPTPSSKLATRIKIVTILEFSAPPLMLVCKPWDFWGS